MRRTVVILIVLALAALTAPAQDPVGVGDGRGQDVVAPAGATRPLEIDRTEQATVRLVLIDVLVIDGQGRPVDGLTEEDFTVLAGGEQVPVDTLDVTCERATEADAARIAGDPAPDAVAPRRIVLLVDYLHMPSDLREGVLDQMKRFVKQDRTAGDEVMLAALTGGLRIEQPFTQDPDEVLRALKRMQYDVSLWSGNFGHLNETGWVGGLEMLFDVLGTFQGPKAVVLYSNMQDVPLELQFERLAALASTSRCAVYPVDPLGLPTLLMLETYRRG